ncbi:hypothetical protein EDD85DRAFT_1030010 [Armillaria nabsnona]|nr:hypothetical protein EDD85DRAFT_1030010 [Armillaria nabsnona]
MCVGDYMQKCPPDVLTPEELAEIKDLPDEVSKLKTLYMLAVETYTKISSWDLYELRGTVLRNWAKHVYVRRDVVVEELARYREEWEDITEEQVKFTRFALSRSGARVY